jgi:hypothetical protein
VSAISVSAKCVLCKYKIALKSITSRVNKGVTIGGVESVSPIYHSTAGGKKDQLKNGIETYVDPPNN